MLIKYGLKSLSFLFALWTQGMDAGYNRRLHAYDGPNRASLRSHPDRCDAYQALFPYPTPMSASKSALFTDPTRLQAPKSTSFTQLTRLHAPKRGVFGIAVYQFLLMYEVYRIRTIESNQIYGV